ncbi:hypothetical protein OG239_40595 [Streptomyces sp. NBC_00868]|nr:hypothetical protein OG239_40595 [Streptomyces sp. NBC_00868]
MSPVRIRVVALPQPTTAGMPSSRATIDACERFGTSVTIAEIRVNSGVQPMFVTVVTRISPGRITSPSSTVATIRAMPSTTPPEAGEPTTVSAAGAVRCASNRSARRLGSAAQAAGSNSPRIRVG